MFSVRVFGCRQLGTPPPPPPTSPPPPPNCLYAGLAGYIFRTSSSLIISLFLSYLTFHWPFHLFIDLFIVSLFISFYQPHRSISLFINLFIYLNFYLRSVRIWLDTFVDPLYLSLRLHIVLSFFMVSSIYLFKYLLDTKLRLHWLTKLDLAQHNAG